MKTPTFLLALALPLMAQTPDKPKEAPATQTIAQALTEPLAALDGELVSLVEAMPEEKFTFAPTQGEFKGVMNFGQMARHIAGANYEMASWILDEKKPQEALDADKGPKEAKTKAEIVQYLKASIAYSKKAFASINASNMLVSRPGPWGGTSTRVTMASFLTLHGFDHYGQLVEYLRMNGIIPPASRK